MTEQEIFNRLPKPPEGSAFSLVKVEKIILPHPYMIMPRHVAHASKYHNGMLGEETMKAIPCGWRDCQLSYSKHEQMMTCFILVPQNKDLNAVPGLHAYILSLKNLSEEQSLGIDGFAFPTRRDG